MGAVEVEKKPLPVGRKDIEDVIERGCYYVDKTLFIKEIIDSAAEVTLFTRPRRFGKTMNMYMLKRFFECDMDSKGEIIDHSKCFNGLKIMSAGKKYKEHMGKYPVIFLTLSGAKALTYKDCIRSLRNDIVDELVHHAYLLQSEKISEKEKEQFSYYYWEKTESNEEYTDALLFLSSLLYKHHGLKPFILVDEYDVPLQNAMLNGFGKEMTSYIRRLFENVFKKNPYLGKGIITGCLRVAKESIFTGMNNLKVCGIMNPTFSEYFGFTQKEVEEALKYYDISDKLPAVKKWYDGYTFGKAEIYNPWSIIMFLEETVKDKVTIPKPYWANTSGNDILNRIMEWSDEDSQVKKDLDSLLAGKTVTKTINDYLTYNQVDDTVENVWSIMFHTGYLTMKQDLHDGRIELCIPNGEVLFAFERLIEQWFSVKASKNGEVQRNFCKAIAEGEAEVAEKIFSRFLKTTISLRDTTTKSRKENFYHGMLLGLLKYNAGWDVKSNVDSGLGYADIVLFDYDNELGIIIEVKYADSIYKMEESCHEALEQINKNQYEEELLENDITHTVRYGISCYKKKCRIMKIVD